MNCRIPECQNWTGVADLDLIVENFYYCQEQQYDLLIPPHNGKDLRGGSALL